MTITTIEREFIEKVSAEVRLEAEGANRYRVFTPFRFDDGDHLVIVLKREDGGWTLSDEAHTYMHLTYEMDEQDLRRGMRQQIIADALSAFGVEDRDGELRLAVPDERYGDALFAFSQALLRIAGVSHLSRERIRSAFRDDFEAAFAEREGGPDADTVKRTFTASVLRGEDWWVAQALEVDVASRGKSIDEALANLRAALTLYFEPPSPSDTPRLYPVEVEVRAP